MKKTSLSLLFMALLAIQANAQLRDVMMKKMGDKMKNDKSKNGTTTTTTDPKTQENTTNTENAGNTNTSTNTTNTNTNSSTNTNTNTSDRYNPNANSNSNGSTTNPYASSYGSGGNKEIKPVYSFSQNVLMQMTKYDAKGNPEKDESHKMRMYFGSEDYSGMEPVDEKKAEKAFMIMESAKQQMVSLVENDGRKIAMVISMDPSKYSSQNGQGQKEEKAPTIQKTGRTKKICGYTAEEWTATDDKGEKTEMWVSSEVPIKATGFYSMFSGSRNKDMSKYFSNSSSYPQGFMMEMTHYDKNGEKFTMTTTEVNANAPKTVETAGYTVY